MRDLVIGDEVRTNKLHDQLVRLAPIKKGKIVDIQDGHLAIVKCNPEDVEDCPVLKEIFGEKYDKTVVHIDVYWLTLMPDELALEEL